MSRDEVASSKINIGGFLTIARAIAIRCRCPPDNDTPLSPIIVSYPSGNFLINSCAFAAIAASLMISSEIDSTP